MAIGAFAHPLQRIAGKQVDGIACHGGAQRLLRCGGGPGARTAKSGELRNKRRPARLGIEEAEIVTISACSRESLSDEPIQCLAQLPRRIELIRRNRDFAGEEATGDAPTGKVPFIAPPIEADMVAVADRRDEIEAEAPGPEAEIPVRWVDCDILNHGYLYNRCRSANPGTCLTGSEETVMLQACLNGARTRLDHPQVPLSPEELARDAGRVVTAGVAELHVHPRDAQGTESLAPQDVEAALMAIRAKVPGIPVGISTREGIRTDKTRGFDDMKRWTVLPNYVSVNLSEEDAPDIIALMIEMGIGVEAGLATAADARRFIHLATGKKCLRVLVEIDFEKDVAGALDLADEIMRILSEGRIDLPLLLHGFDATVWPLYHKSRALGIDSRLGLEDGITLPDGSLAADNLDIIRAALELS